MSEEEIELRGLVAQTLENNGVLSKIRAELRASVFLALEEQESVMDSAQYTNKPLKSFLSTTEGSLVACLVREFLEYFKLDFTLSVFDPETSQGKYYNYGGRSKLMNDLHLQNINGKKGPLLMQVLQIALNHVSSSTNVKKDANKLNNAKNTEVLTSAVRSSAPSSMLLDSSPPNSARGEKVLTPQNINSSKNDTIVTKTTSSNVSVEVKAPSSSKEIGSKPNTELNVKSKFKDSQTVQEEVSPRSLTISELEQASNESKGASKTKTESIETTPSNSPSLQNSAHSKLDIQVPLNSDHSQKSTSKSDVKKREIQQNKASTENVSKIANSTLSSLGNLPPLTGVSFPTKQSTGVLPGINQQKDMHQIKAMIDLGLESQDNYDEDFNSTASASVKEDPTHGTDSEIEEDLGSGVDDLLSSASVMDDLTADATLSNLTGVADYMEDVK